MIEIIRQHTFWVVGQKVSIVAVAENYSVVDTIAPAAVQGPPLHIHKTNSEQFYVLEGELDIITETQRIKLEAGESLIVPQNTPHTFENVTDSDVRLISVYSPPGFEQYFSDMGIAAELPNARESSSDPKIIQRIRTKATRYGMYFPSSPDDGK
jgi:mannose-6-phosphate isomerase-like protein (cupin superfamily)